MLNKSEAMKIKTKEETDFAHKPVTSYCPTTLHVFLPDNCGNAFDAIFR